MHSKRFAPGFRLSPLDIVVLVAGAIASVALAAITWWWGFVVGFVVGHFFLFCNVFRIARPLELAWAVMFVILAGSTIVKDSPSWAVSITASLVMTVVVIIVEMRKPSYHGVGWQWLNPSLAAWWEAHGRG